MTGLHHFRGIAFHAVFLLNVACSSPSPADDDDDTTIKPGDIIVVTADTAELKVRTRVTGMVVRGMRLKVERVQADWLWVHVSVNEDRTVGWLHTRHVQFVSRPQTLPPLDADSYWKWAQERDTAQAYRCFVYHYPDDERVAEAKERWATIDYLRTRASGTWIALRQFLARHPKSQYTMEIRGELQPAHRLLQAQHSDENARLRQRCIEVLTESIQHGDREVVVEAVLALGDCRCHDGSVITRIVRLAKEFRNDYEVASPCAYSLGQIGGPKAVQALAGLLENSRHPSAKEAAAYALIGIDQSDAAAVLVKRLMSPDSAVRWETARYMAQMADARCLDALVQFVNNPEGNDFRIGAVRALGNFDDAGAVSALVQALRLPQESTQIEAALSLGQIGDPSAMDNLVKVLNQSNNDSVRWAAIEAISSIQDLLALDTLVTATRDRNDPVRAAAAAGLSQLGDEHAVDMLVSLLDSPQDWVRERASRALVRVGDPRGIHGLVALLEQTDGGERSRIVSILGTLGTLRHDSVLQPLATALQDSDIIVAQSAAFAIAKIGDPRSAGPLISALQERDNAFQKLGNLGLIAHALACIAVNDDDVLRRLRNLTNHSDPRTRQGAARALYLVAARRYRLLLGGGQEKREASQSPGGSVDLLKRIRSAGSRAGSGETEALERLHEAVRCSSIHVQLAAVPGLVEAGKEDPKVLDELKEVLAESSNATLKLRITGELAPNDPEALQDIRKYLKSDDPVERIYAAEVLGEADGQGVADELVAVLDDEDPLVRIYAATAIIRILDSQATTASKDVSNSGAPAAESAKQE